MRHVFLILALIILTSCARIQRGESLFQFPECPAGVDCTYHAEFKAGPLGVSASGGMTGHGKGPPHVVQPETPPIILPVQPVE